jgi:hypothetical protein
MVEFCRQYSQMGVQPASTIDEKVCIDWHNVFVQAHDTLSDQRLRQKYDLELAEAERLEQASSRYEDGSSEGVAILSMDCPHCEARGIRDACHTAHRISRPMHAARYCREHDTCAARTPFWRPKVVLARCA